MAMVRGTGLVYARSFVRERFGDGAWLELERSFSGADAAVLQGANVRSFYDLRLLAMVERAIGSAFERDCPGVLRELGRYEAERDLSCVTRWFFRVVCPDFAVKHIDLYWRRFHDSGRWTTEVKGSEVVASLDGWGVVDAALCATLTGYLGRVLELIGSPTEVEHRRCRARGDARCDMVFRWRRPRTAPIPEVEVREVAVIGRELVQISDREALAKAITSLLVGTLGLSRAALWDAPPGSGSPLATAGARSDPPRAAHRFVLESRGEAHGWLEVETGDGAPPGEAFEELLPWLGVALAGAPKPVDPGAELAGRVEAGKRRWGLTPRQGDVLSRLAHGRLNKEIACDLGIHEGTVEIHVTQILRKAGVDNRASLIAKLWV